ncbi:AAA family ATPase [Mesorhizobium sp. M0145]|uniref:AAA family ATPase n=1 Tax=Mesorhizobium sp. M0145 TaxID=2956895 RepID=UPI00333789B1
MPYRSSSRSCAIGIRPDSYPTVMVGQSTRFQSPSCLGECSVYCDEPGQHRRDRFRANLTTKASALLTPLPLRVLHGWAAGFLAKLELYSIIARIFGRRISIELTETLDSMPAVALLGPLQVGKTTLAPEITERRPSIYLDLESDADRARLAEPELYLAEHQDKLVILDEVHRLPNLFQNCAG